MTLVQLRYFLAIATAGTMSGAARQIGIAQPALSLQLANLEGELGQRLFVRHGRGMTLTEMGLRLRGRAIDILRHVELARDELSEDAESPVGTVAVGMATAATMAFAVDFHLSVRRRYPRLNVQLVESMSGFLLEWVERGRIDLAVVYDVPAPTAPGVEHLAKEELYLIAGPGSDLAALAALPFRDLRRLPLILPGRQHRLGQLVHRAAASQKMSLDVVAEVDSTYAIKKLVERGEGYSILSRHTVEEEVARGELHAIAIADPAIIRSIDLVLYTLRRLDPSVTAARKTLIDTVAARMRRAAR